MPRAPLVIGLLLALALLPWPLAACTRPAREFLVGDAPAPLVIELDLVADEGDWRGASPTEISYFVGGVAPPGAVSRGPWVGSSASGRFASPGAHRIELPAGAAEIPVVRGCRWFFLAMECEGALPVERRFLVPEAERLHRMRVRLVPAVTLRLPTLEGVAGAEHAKRLVWRHEDRSIADEPVPQAAFERTADYRALLVPAGERLRIGALLTARDAPGFRDGGNALLGIGGVEIDVGSALQQQLQPLALESGHAVKGRVTLRGQPLPHVRIRFQSLEEGLEHMGAELVYMRHYVHRAVRWSKGELILSDVETDTDEAGRFVQRVLAARPYRVFLLDGGALPESPSESHTWLFPSHMILDDPVHEPVVLTPPVEDVHIELPVARVRVRVLKDGAPVLGREIQAQILIREDQENAIAKVTTDAQGEVLIETSPAARMVLTARSSEGTSGELEVAAPAEGEESVVEFVLHEEQPWGEVHIVPTGPHADRVGELELSSDRYGMEWHSRMLNWYGSVHLDRERDGLRVPFLSPGTHRFRGEWYRPKGGRPVLPFEARVEVRPGEETVAHVEVNLGATLQLRLRDANGDLIAARVTVRDEDGEDVEIHWWAHEVRWGSGRRDLLDRLGFAYSASALPPGRYTVECVTEDGRRESPVIDLADGEDRLLEVIFDDE